MLTVSLLSGCTTVQQHPLYSMWQERAYGAYNMPVPAPYVSPFMTTEMPYGAAQGAGTGAVMSVSTQEAKFISEYYSLQ